MNHLDTRAAIYPPAGMYLGSQKALEGRYGCGYAAVVNFYGSKGALAPGFYVVDDRYGRHGYPLAGPFDSESDAEHAYNAWQMASLNLHAHDRFAFAADDSIVYQPTTVINAGVVQLGRKSRIDSFCKLEGGQGLVIGDYVHIASFCHIGIGGGLTILEEGSSFASGAKVISGSNMPDAPSMSATAPLDQQRIMKFTTRICKNAAVLTNAVIMPGVTVGEGARVAAGAVVLEDVPPFTLVAGVPAKIKRERVNHSCGLHMPRHPNPDVHYDSAGDVK